MPIRRELRHLYRGPEWQATRQRTKERAGDRCERCRKRPGTIARSTAGGYVHFIVVQCGAAHLDGNPHNRRDDNLAWLCQTCHLATDRPQHKLSRSIRKDRARPLLALASL